MHKGGYKKGKGKEMLAGAMKEVHKDMPSTCPKGGCPEKQLKAIAFSKARKAGAKLPHKKVAVEKRSQDGDWKAWAKGKSKKGY